MTYVCHYVPHTLKRAHLNFWFHQIGLAPALCQDETPITTSQKRGLWATFLRLGRGLGMPKAPAQLYTIPDCCIHLVGTLGCLLKTREGTGCAQSPRARDIMCDICYLFASGGFG